MKKIFFLIILTIPLTLFSQVGYVSVEDEIYNFLDRMNTLRIIENYNSFEIPKTRKEISDLLIQIIEKQELLDKIDKDKLNDFITEFELEIFSKLEKTESLIPNWNLSYLYSEKEKFLYKYYDSTQTSLFVNFIGKLDYLNKSEDNKNLSSLIYRFGGEIRGSLFNTLGFSVTSTNGSFLGNKELTQSFSSLKYNYKFNQESASQLGDNYFDETVSYGLADFDFAKIKIGNDRKFIGYGIEKTMIGDNAPRMEYIELALKYKRINFTFFHSKLLGNKSVILDSIQGGINLVNDKYLAYHRLGLDLGKYLQLGLGEMIIYSNRNLDFSYLNPFNFYKSSEHANQDRDNSMIFFDAQNNSFENVKIYATLLLDDIDFGKIGTGWYGNQTMLNLGVFSTHLYNILPLDAEIQYIRIDPYVFTHRISDNNFTSSNFNLGSALQPNSSNLLMSLNYRLNYRLNLNFTYEYSVHGANVEYETGKTVNFGGNINLGYRIGDSQNVYFLKGDKEILRSFKFSTQFEPIKNWIFFLNINYFNNSLAKSQRSQNFFTTLSLYTKI